MASGLWAPSIESDIPLGVRSEEEDDRGGGQGEPTEN
jgi:hypothetical protein